MVEDLLKKKKFLSSKNQLYQALNRRVMQQTLSKILLYLEESNKITYNNKDGPFYGFLETRANLRKNLLFLVRLGYGFCL
jgi:hypothetical protein